MRKRESGREGDRRSERKRQGGRGRESWQGQIGRENQGGVKGRDKVESEMVRTRRREIDR